MTKGILAGAVFTALALFGAARAQTCASACTTQHSVCTQAGRDYGVCMGAWRQCKMACLTPARATAPPARATPAVAVRR